MWYQSGMFYVDAQLTEIKEAIKKHGDNFDRIEEETGFTEMQVKYRLRRYGLLDLLPIPKCTATYRELKEQRDQASLRVQRAAYVYGRNWDEIE